MVRLLRKEKQTYWLNSRPQMWPSDLTLAMALTLNFQGQIWYLLYQPKMVQLPRNEKQTYPLNSRPQMRPSGLTLAMTLTLNFQGQIWNLLYSNQKMARLPQNEKQIYRLNFRPQMWPSNFTLAMTLTLNFQGQYGICYISTKSSLISTKRKANVSIELKCHQWVDLGHDLQLWIFKV